MRRPLVHADARGLGEYLAELSPESRRSSTFDGYGLGAARELGDAIGRYDKLRLVLEEVPSTRIVGLLEFSPALTAGDVARETARLLGRTRIILWGDVMAASTRARRWL